MKRVLSVILILLVAILFCRRNDMHTKVGREKHLLRLAATENRSEVEKLAGDRLNEPAANTPANDEFVYEVGEGASREWLIVALDEAIARDEQGLETIVKLDPAASRKTLPSRLQALSAVGGIFPVAYVRDRPRSIETRRVVTSELRIKADNITLQKLTDRYAIVIKDRPVYAPDWAILSAANPCAALDVVAALRKEQGIAAADVLFAVQRMPRTMPNDPLMGDQWHYKNATMPRTHMNIESAWNYGGNGGVKGAGVRIGIVDDGLQTAHPDLVDNADTVNDKDWNGKDDDANPGPGNIHGTACAGNAAARGNNSIGVSGSAPEATLVGMRLTAGSTTDAQEAEAMSYLPQMISILSNSWGPDDTGDLLEAPSSLTQQAFQYAATTGRGGKGSIILWAAGNGGDVGDNSNYDGYANSIYTIAVGATDSAGMRAYYTEPGSNVVICAPSSGVLGITTVDRMDTGGYNRVTSANGGDYTNDFGGTSSSTPSVAGVVALLLEKNPLLGWRDVQEILMRSAYRCDATSNDWQANGAGLFFHHDYGAGLVDAAAAVALAATWKNLAAQTSVVAATSSLPVAIPENNIVGITRAFTINAPDLRVEHATVRLSITHTARGNLAITLTSPSGMVSRLSEVHTDKNDHYSDWSFSSVRHWAENAQGTWTLHIADRSGLGNTKGGTLTAAELTIFGSVPVPPDNNGAHDYAYWAAAYSLGSDSALSADPDHDGIANGVENVLGTRPDQTSVGLEKIASSAGLLVFEHNRSKVVATDLSYHYEWSTNLQQWHPSGTAVNGTVVSITAIELAEMQNPSSDRLRVSAMATGVIPAQLYLRLSVAQAP